MSSGDTPISAAIREVQARRRRDGEHRRQQPAQFGEGDGGGGTRRAA